MAEEKMNQNGAAGEACTDTGQPETSAAAGQEAEKAAEEKKDTVKDPSGAVEAADKKETEDSVKAASKEDVAAAKDSGRGFFGKKSSKEKALRVRQLQKENREGEAAAVFSRRTGCH